MDAVLQHVLSQSVVYALFAVAIFAFLESLALVGLLMPGTLVMAGLGALIGSGELNLYSAWLAGTLGCLAGDVISWWLGWRFNVPLRRWHFLQRYKTGLARTEYALHQHSMATLLIGRFIGPTRPLVPLVAGMLGLPLRRFLPASVIGCILWPPLYFMPGILAGAAIAIPDDRQSAAFLWLLASTAVLVWLSAWLCWRLWRVHRAIKMPARWLTAKRLRILAPVSLLLAGIGAVALIRQPLLDVYLAIIRQAFSGH